MIKISNNLEEVLEDRFGFDNNEVLDSEINNSAGIFSLPNDDLDVTHSIFRQSSIVGTNEFLVMCN